MASRPSRDLIVSARQAISYDWWDNQRQRFELRVSALVEEEVSRGDSSAVERRLAIIANIPSLSISDAAITLAEMLIERRAVPRGSEEDALHIAIAATQGADYLLT